LEVVSRLVYWVSPFARRTKTERLGPLTISMLKGSQGHQRKEVEKLVSWLTTEFQPDVVVLSNVLISGLVPALRERYAGPVVATLQGDDIFLDALPEADRAECFALIRENGKSLSGYIATSRYYADYMARYLGLPRDRIDVVHPGINTRDLGTPRETRTELPYAVGYFARICPEKGFHNIVDAFCLLRQNSNAPPCVLRASGWLGSNYARYFRDQLAKLDDAGLRGGFEYVDCPTHADKVRFLQSLDVLSVPTVYREPKGLYVLESLACGVPVVQPRHGAFPELIEATGGGILVEPGDLRAHAEGLQQLLADASLRRQLGESGQYAVLDRFTSEVMARETAAVLTQYHQRNGAGAQTTAEAIAT
jgi:glycosyltransferase involved in cell wall biosynthesis